MARRRFYTSENGDTWDLVREDDRLSVLHTPNLASGGNAKQIALDAFLPVERHSAQNVALVRLIGMLVDDTA